MRLVVDTNVFVSAALKESSWPSHTVRWLAKFGGLLKSTETEDELFAVLRRPRFAGKIAPIFLEEVTGIFAAAERVAITERINLCRDPMPVLDVKNLGLSELRGLAGAFDRLGAETLAPIRQMDQDPVRDQIDGAIAAVLGLPSIAPLRNLLAHEPAICNAPLWTSDAVSAVEMSAQFDLLLPEIARAPGD